MNQSCHFAWVTGIQSRIYISTTKPLKIYQTLIRNSYYWSVWLTLDEYCFSCFLKSCSCCFISASTSLVRLSVALSICEERKLFLAAWISISCCLWCMRRFWSFRRYSLEEVVRFDKRLFCMADSPWMKSHLLELAPNIKKTQNLEYMLPVHLGNWETSNCFRENRVQFSLKCRFIKVLLWTVAEIQ